MDICKLFASTFKIIYSVDQKVKLRKIISYILRVYVPSSMIHSKPRVPEGPFLTLLQRDLFLAFCKTEPDIVDMTMSVHSEVHHIHLRLPNPALYQTP